MAEHPAPVVPAMPAAAQARRQLAGARPHRLQTLAMLGAAVLWGHALLIQALAPATPRQAGPAPRLPVALEVRRLPPPADPAPVVAVDGPEAAASLRPSKSAPAVTSTAAVRGTQPSAVPSNPPAAAAGTEAADVAASPQTDTAAAAGDAPASEADAPPLYATRLPGPVQLSYALRYNGHAGEALLRWQHDGQHYSLALSGQGLAGARPLLAQASQGALDANGLAPERFVDRRQRGRQQAANFRRDTGRIGFSGTATDFPAWPGAQDRLSWLVQLAAILAAGHAGPQVRLFVVDARGAGSLWYLQRQPDETLDTPWGAAALQLWQREPPRPEGLRVQAWLDATRGHWPVRLRFTALRSGDVFELRLLAEPTAPELPTPP